MGEGAAVTRSVPEVGDSSHAQRPYSLTALALQSHSLRSEPVILQSQTAHSDRLLEQRLSCGCGRQGSASAQWAGAVAALT